MNALKKFYQGFCKAEELLVAALIFVMTSLIFIAALFRQFGSPLNWASDVALLLFAWTVMLGADVALKRADFIKVSILTDLFPARIQKFLYYLWNILIILFLALFVRYGFPLARDSWLRIFQTLGISYSWATISVPIAAILMISTIVIRLVANWNKDVIVSNAKEAI